MVEKTISQITLRGFMIKKGSHMINTTLYTIIKRYCRKEESIDYEHGEKHVKREELSERVMGIRDIHNFLFVEYVSYKEA